MRCHACGARNVGDADWCTQCYASFAVEEAPREATPATEPTPDASSSGGAADGGTEVIQQTAPEDGTSRASMRPSASVAGATVDRDVRDIDGRVEWRCPTCGAWVELEAPTCTTCGAARVGFGDVAHPDATTVEVAPSTMLVASVAMPGLGHVLAGRIGSGATRIALFALWGIGGLWWVLSTPGGRSPGMVLLLGALVLWVASVIDANAIAQQATREPFGVRGLLWTVVGVTGLLMVMVAVAAAGAVGS